jgi:hypothetical protein
MTGPLVHMAAQARYADSQLARRHPTPPRKPQAEGDRTKMRAVRIWLHRRAYATG